MKKVTEGELIQKVSWAIGSGPFADRHLRAESDEYAESFVQAGRDLLRERGSFEEFGAEDLGERFCAVCFGEGKYAEFGEDGRKMVNRWGRLAFDVLKEHSGFLAKTGVGKVQKGQGFQDSPPMSEGETTSIDDGLGIA